MDMSWGQKVNDNLVKGGHGIDKRAGYVLRLNYSYDDKYLLEITSRSMLRRPCLRSTDGVYFPVSL